MFSIDNMRKEIIQRYECDSFTANDFISLGEYDAIRQALTGLMKTGYIRRVMHGVYDKPRYSKILDEYSTPAS